MVQDKYKPSKVVSAVKDAMLKMSYLERQRLMQDVLSSLEGQFPPDVIDSLVGGYSKMGVVTAKELVVMMSIAVADAYGDMGGPNGEKG